MYIKAERREREEAERKAAEEREPAEREERERPREQASHVAARQELRPRHVDSRAEATGQSGLGRG